MESQTCPISAYKREILERNLWNLGRCDDTRFIQLPHNKYVLEVRKETFALIIYPQFTEIPPGDYTLYKFKQNSTCEDAYEIILQYPDAMYEIAIHIRFYSIPETTTESALSYMSRMAPFALSSEIMRRVELPSRIMTIIEYGQLQVTRVIDIPRDRLGYITLDIQWGLNPDESELDAVIPTWRDSLTYMTPSTGDILMRYMTNVESITGNIITTRQLPTTRITLELCPALEEITRPQVVHSLVKTIRGRSSLYNNNDFDLYYAVYHLHDGRVLQTVINTSSAEQRQVHISLQIANNAHALWSAIQPNYRYYWLYSALTNRGLIAKHKQKPRLLPI